MYVQCLDRCCVMMQSVETKHRLPSANSMASYPARGEQTQLPLLCCLNQSRCSSYTCLIGRVRARLNVLACVARCVEQLIAEFLARGVRKSHVNSDIPTLCTLCAPSTSIPSGGSFLLPTPNPPPFLGDPLDKILQRISTDGLSSQRGTRYRRGGKERGHAWLFFLFFLSLG